MLSLLEILITLIGVVLILALVSQNLIELLKSGFALKGITRSRALQGLIVQATDATDAGTEQAGRKIFEQVVKRLRGLGQEGVRKEAVRIDSLDAKGLASIIEAVDLRDVPGIDSKEAIEEVAAKAEEWFSVAMNAVDGRHLRRMRGWTLLTSAVVVIGLNVDAIRLLELARTDPQFRADVAEAVERVSLAVDTLDERVATALAATPTDTAAPDTTAADTAATGVGDTVAAGAALLARQSSVAEAQDSLNNVLLELASAEDGILAQIAGPRNWGELDWWIGIIVMTLLVSLGAPFWHDLLGSLMGMRKQIQNNARADASGQPPGQESDQTG